MRTIKNLSVISFLFFALTISVQPAIAQVPTNAWVECELLQVQTGLQDGLEDTRLLLTALDASFTETWLIVDRDAAKMVAAGALTAFSMGYNVNVRIISYGSGYRIEKLRVMQPSE